MRRLIVSPPSAASVCCLGVTAFVASTLIINLLWIVSMYAGSVPWCFPYWDGAISVSYAIRTPPAVYAGKPALTVIGLILMVYWWHLARHAGWHRHPVGRFTLALGLASGVFLWLYLYALGIDGEGYRLLRRTGTYGHIICGSLAQILATGLLWRERQPSSRRLLLWLWVLMGWMLFLAAVGLPLLAAYTTLSQARRTVEWHYFLVMYAWLAVSGWSRRLQDQPAVCRSRR